MIAKSYEIQKSLTNFLKYNFFLLYGENEGLKKDIKNLILNNLKAKDANIENLILYESEILDDKDNFFNSIYSGSLFSNNKLISINNGSDKLVKYIENITDKKPENVFFIIFAEVLEKKSKFCN